MSVPNQPNPFLHQRSNVQPIRVSSVRRNDSDPSHLLYRQERFVQRLAHIGLQRQRLTDLVHDRLGFVESGSVNSDVQPIGNELLDLLGHVCVDGEVDGVYTHLLRLSETVGNLVNPDDPGGAFEESPLGYTKSDGTQSLKEKKTSLGLLDEPRRLSKSYPNADNVALLHASILNSMVRGGQHIR